MSVRVPDISTGRDSSGRGSEYAALSRLIRQHGLLNRRPRYYAAKMIVSQ
jgi:hypothetical protein